MAKLKPTAAVPACFTNVNDDNVKFYGRNQTAQRLVICQQVNGAVFQLSWGSGNGKNCLAQDIDIDVIRCENNTKPSSREGNQPVLNLVKQGAGNVIDGIRLEPVRVEDGFGFLVGLRQASVTVRNITLNDITITGKVRGTNHLRAAQSRVVQPAHRQAHGRWFVRQRGRTVHAAGRLGQRASRLARGGKVEVTCNALN